MTSFAIAGLQLEAAAGSNLELMIREIDAVVARYPWIDMVVCPELTYTTDREAAEAMPGPTEQRFQEVAKRHEIWLLPGSFYEIDGEQLFNTVPVISPQGDVITRHRKLFPWCPYEKGITPGVQHTVFDVPGIGRFGVSNCYDMWFPETIRALAWQGAEIILHPSLTSSIDRDAERAMVRAHAAQNQCYFFDVNLAGVLGVGESLVAGPGGELVHSAGKTREIIALKLDIDYLHEVRASGWQNLGQPLKSFRDSALEYPQYDPEGHSQAMEKLGELRMTTRKNRD